MSPAKNPVLHDLDRARAYHHATKHTPRSVRGGRELDWENQPSAFRRFDGAPLVALDRAPGALAGTTGDALGRLLEPPRQSTTGVFDREQAGRLLHHSVAISAWKQQRGRLGVARWSLRVNPSSGNLHPTETYLAVRGAPGLEDGLHHYRADRHALELRRRGDAVRALLAAAGRDDAGVTAVVALTTVAWREAWKYRDRAWRYCCLDAGHAAHGVLVAAHALGLQGGVVARFADSILAGALAVDDGDERPLVLVPLGPRDAIAALARPSRPASAVALEAPLGVPNRLSPQVEPYPLIDAIALAGALEPDDLAEAAPPLRARGRAAEPPAFALPEPARLDAPLAKVVRVRRSALDFVRDRSDLALDGLAAALAATRAPFPFDAIGRWPGVPSGATHDGLSLHVWAHAVPGLGAGLYRVAPDGRALAPLGARSGRDEARDLSLEQELAGDGACAFSIVADLEQHLTTQGCRGYRDAFLLAGALGHALYLSAHALGRGVTGIGAFYDDAVIAHLGLDPAVDGEPVYHAAIGAPVDDERLTGEDGPAWSEEDDA